MPSNSRVARLAELQNNLGADVFLAWSASSMGYLFGFFENSHERFMALAVSAKGDYAFIAPALSGAQAARSGIDNLRLWSDGEDPYSIVVGLASDWGFGQGTVALDPAMPAHMVLGLQAALPQCRMVDGEPLLASLRRAKDAREIEAMKRAGGIADRAFLAALPRIREGMSEVELARILEAEMSAHGGNPTFCIVAFGPGSAEPHHMNGDSRLRRGEIVLMDFGCEADGYNSDITRTVSFGPAPDGATAAYGAVYQAHMAAREAIRAGIPCQDVDRAARAVIDAAGFGEAFFHRTGHGIGLEVHEAPYIVEGNEDVLRSGDCFSVEPGVYFEGKWGIRIENIVAATDSGHISMNEEPSPDLIEIGA